MLPDIFEDETEKCCECVESVNFVLGLSDQVLEFLFLVLLCWGGRGRDVRTCLTGGLPEFQQIPQVVMRVVDCPAEFDLGVVKAVMRTGKSCGNIVFIKQAAR